MAWTTLPTYTSGSVLTAAQMNAIAANINETSAATATTAGDLVVADAANSMGTRIAAAAAGAFFVSAGTSTAPKYSTWAEDEDLTTTFTTTSSTFTNSLTGGALPSVSLTTGTRVLVVISGWVTSSVAGDTCRLSYSVSGATTSAASAYKSITYTGTADGGVRGSFVRPSAVTGGSNTFDMEANVTGSGTLTVLDPQITVYSLS